MENFIVSARKYRPETFNSVIGQNSIASTLKSAIKSNRLGHAYLFCGPRGVGKTTLARIFAKTINCNSPTIDYEPCNACESCLAFNASRSYNIHELDGASNNSVDGMRSLTEQVRIPPQIGRYSVYIIDEVHMLSASAFNAFLKTLEEPPPHAVFILATTEKHKIIPTILSRCQIFDFNRIKAEDTVSYLEYIAGQENIAYEKEALQVIAQKADGAMRDALSIFDQIVSFSGKSIKYQNVLENLNILDVEYYFRITDSLLEGNYIEGLLIFDEILSHGFDGQNFLSGLSSHFRDLLVSLDPSTIKLLETTDSVKLRYKEQAAKCDPGFLFSALDVCNQAEISFKASNNQRLLMELTLLRLSALKGLKKKSPIVQSENPQKESPIVQPENPQKESSGQIDESDQNLSKVVLSEKEIVDNTSEKLTTQKNPENTDNKHIHIIETPKNPHSQNLVRTTKISIKDITSDHNNERVVVREDEDDQEASKDDYSDSEELLDNPFSADDLNNYWKQFAEKISVEKPRISSTLLNCSPKLLNDFSIEINLNNISQLEDFNQNVKIELQSFLRKNLLNSYIQILPRLEANENSGNGKRKLYTSEEQFQYLNRKNPNLNRLKQQFNLDFE